MLTRFNYIKKIANVWKLVLVLMVVLLGACQAQTTQILLSPKDFHQKIQSDKNSGATLLDVRTPDEYSRGTIASAQNIAFGSGDFESKIKALDKSKTYYVFCLSGGRSASAAHFMRRNGFESVFELKGGILAWEKDGLPIVSARSLKDKADKITWTEYQNMIKSSEKVLVDFYAPWCAPCKKIEPMLTDLSQKYSEKAKIIRINVDENKELAQNLEIDAIPLLILYKNGKPKWNHNGMIEKTALEKALVD